MKLSIIALLVAVLLAFAIAEDTLAEVKFPSLHIQIPSEFNQPIML